MIATNKPSIELRSLTRLQFSKSFGILHQGKDDHNLMGAIDEGLALTSYLGLYLWIKSPLMRLLSLLSNPSVEYLASFISQQISHSKQKTNDVSSGESGYMMQKLISVHNKDPGSITQWDLETTAGANIGAGAIRPPLVSAQLFFIFTALLGPLSVFVKRSLIIQ